MTKSIAGLDVPKRNLLRHFKVERHTVVRIPHGRYSLSVMFNYVLCLPNFESINDGNGRQS